MMIQHQFGQSNQAASPVALLDVLVRAMRADRDVAAHGVCLPIDAATLAALHARAERLDIPLDHLCSAALALVDSRLTGNPEVMIGAASTAAPSVFTIAAEADVDTWLGANAVIAPVSIPPAAAPLLMPSTIGVWADNAATAEVASASASIAWWIDSAGLNARFRAPLLDEATRNLLAGALGNVLRGFATAHHLADISALDAEESRRLLIDWNATAVARRAGDTVHGLFGAIARQYPERTALVDGNARLAYRELDARSDRVAAALIAAGIAPGTPVAVLLDRSIAAIIAVIGILKAGAAYLPLDHTHPPERLAFAISDARAPLVIVQHDHVPKLADCGARAVAIEDLEANPTGFAAPALDGSALAYVMYTSGSTGTPKGVEITHRSIIRLVREVDYVAFGDAPCVLHAAPLGFDASTLEIWGALLNGGTVVIHAERIPTGRGLAQTIARHGVRIAWLTGALFNAIVDEDPRHLAGLDQLLIGGEALSVPHVRKALAALPDTAIINGYGPTECTTFAATYRIPRDLPADTRTIPIGKPIADTTLYVLNARGEPLPTGVIGELHIGGAGVARGYLNRPELTAERFIADPFGVPGARLYRTGDRVRWQSTGVVEFVGRADGQIKIRGYRIETGEIEAALKNHPAVRAVAVIAREDRPGCKRLVAYYVEDAPVAAAALRAALTRVLPEFMVPALYVRLDALPVTENGKLDRHALPVPDTQRPELAVAYAAPRDATEARVCTLFADLVGIDRAGRDDNFFDLGGDSLLAVKTVTALNAGHVTLSITDFFRAPTPIGIAALMECGADRTIPAERLVRRERADTAEPIAIIAMAGRFPGAADVETFWRNLCDGEESITFFTPEQIDPGVPRKLRDDPAYIRARGVLDNVEDFDAAFFGIAPREADLMDPQQRIFLELCWECIERAGHVPDEHAAPVGVFAGMYNATYWQRHVSRHPELVEKLGEFQVMLGNEKDYIATRVAHKLNLTGPAISVHTACSTSLVAICQAADALRTGQCAMALAGGASLTCPPRSGYLYQDGAMLSPDGHTRTFAADAQGTLFSDGAAVVLLKRLADALADGDPVYAVIRGGAVNNDGGVKASFTAPSSAGQAAVIAMALDAASVDARSISYVEAHGTATPLGDPIEIEGLTTAFRRSTDATGYCAIGSLKSNVGHLVIAAGAAGVIKTAFALAERRLPPTLHVGATNPVIDFAHSPFVVNRELREWRDDAGPLRAGVSSFGVGGTNAHVILEQAPPRAASDPAEGPCLLPLSARTPQALAAAAQRLGAHLAAEPGINLADVAYTLAHGRKAFAQRGAIVADDVEDAIRQLGDAGSALRATEAQATGIVFMFPGQGAQYAGMGRALHAREPAFRDALDACAEILAGELGFDLRERLFADDADVLRETALTQPATFAIEYALAQLWISAGIRPVALVGHSIGEFVAAALAGVMRLDDALHLMARRGRLMQAQPTGAMLSVRLGAEQLAARLPASLALAAENAPNACVVSGEIADIETLRVALAADGVACRPLHTSHAFHSAMMDPVLAPFRAEVARIALTAPTIAIASTRTGAWLTAAEATSTDYWTRHLRDCVRFAPALATVLEDHKDAIVLEVGPRTTLSMLARQQALRPRAAIASLADTPEREYRAWLGAAGQLWCAGAPVDFSLLDRRTRKRRVRLPTYPFERKRHWVDASPVANVESPVAVTTARSVISIPPMTIPETVVATASPVVPSAADRRPRVLARIKEQIEDVSGIEVDDADPDANFIELGLDSLALTQLALQLSKSFGIKLTFRQLMEDLSSLERLVMHIDHELPPDAAPSAPTALTPLQGIPIAASPLAATGTLPSGFMQQVIQQQMLLMQQQLALLGGAELASASPLAAAMPMPAATLAPTVAAGTAAVQDEEAALEHTHYDVKKAFGAIARIHSTHTEISQRQRARLDAFMRRYISRTQKSKDYTSKHRPHLADPRVVNGFRPLLKEIIYQIVIERSKGGRLWDLDGNEYIDALNGFGMNLFGWQPDFVLDAVRRQLDQGYEIGPQHPLAGEVAQLICELTGIDRAGLCNTGSEAVMGAMRIARTVTGRNTLVIFTGSYHGIFDEVIVRGTQETALGAGRAGHPAQDRRRTCWCSTTARRNRCAIIRERAHELAAVLVEPVQSRRPDLQPREFLHELRTVTREAGALLIFDEVITGFRVASRRRAGVLRRARRPRRPTARSSAAACRSASIAGKRELHGRARWRRVAVRRRLVSRASASPISPAPSCVIRSRWPRPGPCWNISRGRACAAGASQCAHRDDGGRDECALRRSRCAHRNHPLLVGVADQLC